ncbi:MAG: succinate dehydrogenase/fumarate reductase iron-sulfur subunit [Thermodesulfobacteriota bacterium]|nr:succinate dehydrogenase/fumarate reductase iron-sulfur subunit [Thermodesulfobacteriota bacterium]
MRKLTVMDTSALILKIKRYNPEKDPPRWTETFNVETKKGMNLLEALLRIQDEQDPTLSFRYSCRGAVCGSCAMKVNGKLVLACRTPVEGLLGETTLIEPLPFFPVIRDLIVDMSLFFEHYRGIEPYLHGKPIPSDCEYMMMESERKEIDPYIQCILCGICFGVCPAFGRDAQFLGPAILAKAYRFLRDPRDRREKEILNGVNDHRGVWGCNTVFQCVKACPKEVPPTHAIVKMRGRILRYRFTSLFSRFLSMSRRIGSR